MAKVIDITSKLEFDGNPRIRIKDVELEVNADAPTMLKIMGMMSDDPTPKQVIELYKLIFPQEAQEKIDSMKLSFKNLIVVVQAAVGVITGDTDEAGEH